jgi:acyl dehydratase
MTAVAGPVSVGASRELVAVEDLTRTQIVQYAGASGDYNPIHTDERYATDVGGYTSVFAHGMLTMGMAGRLITDWFGAESVLRLSARFRAIVYPGARLVVSGTVTAVDDSAGTATVDVSVVDQDGTTVLSAQSTVRTGR